MFDHIVLRRSEDGTPVTAGQIAESLIYYQKVHVIFDDSTLLKLIDQIGIDSTLRLLDIPDLSAVYTEETLAINTRIHGVLPCHDLIAFKYFGDDNRKVKYPAEKIEYRLEKKGITKRAARKFAESFISKAPTKNYTSDHFIKGGIINSTRAELLNKNFIEEAVLAALNSTPGSYPIDKVNIDIIKSDLGYFIYTNIDWDRINHNRAALRNPEIGPINITEILNRILEANADLALSAHYGGDFQTSERASKIIQIKYSHLLSRSDKNASELDNFKEIVLSNAPSIREVIDRGERSIEEFYKLFNNADKFKKWAKGINPDEGIIKAYINEMKAEDTIQKLPAKAARYVINLAADAFNPALGAIFGFADNFLIDKLLRNWKPNHFIDDKINPFLRTR